MKTHLLSPIIVGLLFIGTFSVKAEEKKDAALEAIKGSVGQIVQILSTHKGAEKKEERNKKISEIFYANFDLIKLTRYTLKSHWKELSTEQKKTFVNKYAEFVLSFYTGKLDTYNNNKVEYKSSEYSSSGKKATVYTLVEYNGAMSKVNYNMSLKDDQWKIYDVEIEGVRLTSTYRSQFQSQLDKNGFDGTIKAIDDLISKQSQTASK